MQAPIVLQEAMDGKPAPKHPLPRGAERPPLENWSEIFALADPQRIMGRLLDLDPLDLHPVCSRRVRERAYLIDPQRVYDACIERVAIRWESAPKEADLEWLTGEVDHRSAWF